MSQGDSVGLVRHHTKQAISSVWLRLLLTVVLPLGAVSATPAMAEEPYQRFLQRLKEEQLFDLALLYLEDLEANPRTSAEFKADVDLEKGLLLYQAAASLPNRNANRDGKLDAAEDSIREFLASKGNHPRRGEARLKLGELLLTRAEEAKAGAEPGADNPPAIGFFDAAHKLFEATIEELAGILERMKGARTDPNDKTKVAYRQKVQQDLRQAQLLSAKSVEERGQSRAAGSSEQKADLQQALRMFNDLYAKEQQMVGVRNYALYYRSEIQAALEKIDDAIDGFQRIADLGAIDVLRPLQASAITELLKLLGEKRKFAIAVNRADAWISQLRPDERETAETVALKIQLAKTKIAWSQALRKEDPDDRVASRMLNNTRNELRSLLRIPGAHLDEARELLADLGVESKADTVATDLPDVKDFSEALAAAQERIEEAEEQSLELELQREGGTSDVQELEAAVSLRRDQAIQLLRSALRLYSAADGREPLVEAQFRLAYLLLKQNDPWGALTVAELLARQNRGTDQGLRAASIALNAMSDLLRSAGESAKVELIEHLEPFSQYLMSFWPDSAEASAAASAVVQLSLLDGNIEKAEAFLAQLPASSPSVGKLRRELGLKLFENYLTAKNESESTSPQVESLRAKATEALEAGCNSLTADALDGRAIEAMNALASLYTLENRNDEAAQLLLEGDLSPLKAIESNPDIASPRTAMNSFRVAIRIVINQLADGKLESSVATSQTQAYVKRLQSLATSVEDGDTVLAGMFVGLAQDVKTQKDEIQDPQKRRRLSDALVLVAAEAGKSDSFNAQYWAADTLISTAEELQLDRAGREVAMKAYLSAGQLLDEILAKEQAQPGWISPAGFKTQVRLQHAKSKRGLGDFKSAIDEMAELLEENSGLLTVQIEAARTYQAWGDTIYSGFHKAACVGGRPDQKTGQNLIWGWGKLAQKVVGREEFEDQFYLARYELARSRLKYAQGLKDPQQQRTETAKAEKDVTSTAALYPKLGGPEMKKKYNALLKEIQRLLDKPAEGLAALSK